ncbi:HAMP domain-containing protein [bacterium]|nr:HAMP domain-containing protein [bacterium]
MKKISSQISAALIILFLVGFIILLVITDQLLKKNLQDQIVEDLKIQCVLIDNLLPQDTDSIQLAVSRLSKMVDARITVIDPSGDVLGESDEHHKLADLDNHLNRDEVQEALRNIDGFGFSIRYSQTVKEDLVYTAYKSDRQRFIRLAKQQRFVDSVVWKVRWLLFASAFGAIAIVLIMVPRVSRSLTRPLTDIITAAEDIKGGNYDREILVSEDNEIGELGKILNSMSAKLKGDIIQLNQLQEIRKDFVANASHELRTPISSIRGFVETLLDGAYHDEEVSRKFLERTLSNVIRLENIVNDMLDLSKLEVRDKGLSLRYFDVGEHVRPILSDFEERANKKGLDLKFESSLPADYKLFADPYQFEKAMTNLIENAVKYTENGYVKVSVQKVNEEVAVTVEDTGHGVRQEDITRIFERFYRVDKGRSRQQGGSGLGLSIVKHVMEIHNGSVRVESEINKGSRFILTFPTM